MALKKNCTNCKCIIPVGGTDYGFCSCEKHLGRIATIHTVCSDYQETIDTGLSSCKGCFVYKTIEQRENDAYVKGFADGNEYATKIEELAAINENLTNQLTELQDEYNKVLTELLEARKPSKKLKKPVDKPLPGQLTIFEAQGDL